MGGFVYCVVRGGFLGVLYEEYIYLCCWVEWMEYVVGGIIGKIDVVFFKLVNLEKVKIWRCDVIVKILNYLSEVS